MLSLKEGSVIVIELRGSFWVARTWVSTHAGDPIACYNIVLRSLFSIRHLLAFGGHVHRHGLSLPWACCSRMRSCCPQLCRSPNSLACLGS